MHVFLTAFWLPKLGNHREEYEDAFWPKSLDELEDQGLKFAVADGATEGMLSGYWADILVKKFCRSNGEKTTPKSFPNSSYEAWDAWKRGYLRRRERANRPIQWFEEEGIRTGPFAAFVGLALHDPQESEASGNWEAVAVGDSCLFQVRGNTLVTAFPIQHSSEFGNRPFLLSSDPGRNQELMEHLRTDQGNWTSDDSFYLMTDALAAWFLHEHEQGQRPWAILRDLETDGWPESFEEWIGRLRIERQMRNDDVTLLRIDID